MGPPVKPALKIVPPSQGIGRALKQREGAATVTPASRLTSALLFGILAGSAAAALIMSQGVRDARLLLTSSTLIFGGALYLMMANLQVFLPRAYGHRKDGFGSALTGVPLGIVVYFVWKIFPPIYAAVDEIVWRASLPEEGGSAYVESLQFAFATTGSYALGLVLGALVLSLQVGLWFLPAYLIARQRTKSAEEKAERVYREKVRKATRRYVGRRARLTKFKVGGDLSAIKVQLRVYHLGLVLASGLVAMTGLAWVWSLP